MRKILCDMLKARDGCLAVGGSGRIGETRIDVQSFIWVIGHYMDDSESPMP